MKAKPTLEEFAETLFSIEVTPLGRELLRRVEAGENVVLHPPLRHGTLEVLRALARLEDEQ